MRKFDNSEYEALVKDLIGDTFYVETSFRGKIAKLRQFAEVIVRKLLDLDPNIEMTLGKKDITNKISSLNNNELILKNLQNINKNGSNYTHTQKKNEVLEEEFDNTVDSLLNLLSVFFINYFEKYEFGSNEKVMASFSLLPPIVRYKVLMFLYSKHPQNISIIDKLVLATLKSFNADEAFSWVEERKDTLNKMKTISEKVFNEISEKMGIDVALELQNSGPSNMYQLCKQKILKIGNVIELKGNLYSDFESALPFYQEKGMLEGTEPEILEFNDIMSFVYLGRKKKLQEISGDSDSYIIMNFIS